MTYHPSALGADAAVPETAPGAGTAPVAVTTTTAGDVTATPAPDPTKTAGAAAKTGMGLLGWAAAAGAVWFAFFRKPKPPTA